MKEQRITLSLGRGWLRSSRVRVASAMPGSMFLAKAWIQKIMQRVFGRRLDSRF